MKKLFIFSTYFFSLITFNNVSGQFTEDWVARYNGPDNKNDNARLIATDASGNIIVTGSSSNKKGVWGYITTVKYNPANGDQMFVARFAGPLNGNGDQYPYGLTVDNAGSIYVTGRSQGNGTGLDFVTIKYNSSLEQQWVARYNSPANLNDESGDVQVDAAGNVFVTGYSDLISNVNGDIIVTIKYNSAGVQQWIANYDVLTNNGTNETQEEGVSLALDGNGNVFVTGVSGGLVTIKYNSSGQLIWSRNGNGSNGRKILMDGSENVVVTSWGNDDRFVTIKYNSNGDLLWEAFYDGNPNGFDSGWDMALDASDNIYVTGTSSNGLSNDYATVKYNSSGVQQWASRFNGADNDRDHARAIAVDVNGNAYVTGYTTAKSGRSIYSYYATVKYASATGNQEWVAIYKGPDNGGSHGFDIAVDAFDNVYVTGESRNSGAKTNLDYATIKYSESSSSLKTIITDPVPETPAVFEVKNYPNPFYQNTTIQYKLPKDGKVRLSVIDLMGNEIITLVNEMKPAGVYTAKFKNDKLPAGTYLYRIQAGEYIETKKLVIIK